MRPAQLRTKPIHIMQMPYLAETVSIWTRRKGEGVMRTHRTIMIGMKMLGRKRLRRMLVRGSKIEYETKKIVSAALYWLSLIPRSLSRWTSFALPMLVLSIPD